jgi:hypothetical protein
MVYGTIALWQINKINELVREQAMFNAVHAPDYVDESISQDRRSAVIEAGVRISALLHGGGIGTGRDDWYVPLKDCVDRDLKALHARRGLRNAVRRNAVFIPGDVAVLAGLIIVATAYVNSL